MSDELKYELKIKGGGEEINYYIADSDGREYGEVFTCNKEEAQEWVKKLNTRPEPKRDDELMENISEALQVLLVVIESPCDSTLGKLRDIAFQRKTIVEALALIPKTEEEST